MIVLFTDFGSDGPYLGQVEAKIAQINPVCRVINLQSDAPRQDPYRSAYLLAALAREIPEGAVILGVVDPGVGGERRPVVLEADGRWFVGPDNGLFNTVAVHAVAARWFEIDWRPGQLSASFHGRDLFAPIAARLAAGTLDFERRPYAGPDLARWQADLAEIVYIDHYGNAMSGLRYRPELRGAVLCVGGEELSEGRTFSSVPAGTPFWYCNSIGLVEVAVNCGRADTGLGLRLGSPLAWRVGTTAEGEESSTEHSMSPAREGDRSRDG